MADERWRALERRWQQTGAVADEAALLAERVRAGDLTEERARLLAWLGHEAAVVVAGPGFDTSALADPAALADTQRAFWTGVFAFWPAPAARAVLASARARRRQVVGEWQQMVKEKQLHHGPVFVGWVRAVSQCVDSGVSWVLSPTDAARVVLEQDVERVNSVGEPPAWPGPADNAAVRQATRELAIAVNALVELANGREGRPSAEVADASHFEALRATLRAEVVPWALGLHDPLKDEVTGRLAAVSNIRIASPCHVSWEDMRPVDGDARVRHCAPCDQPVFDFNKLPLDEAEAIVRAREEGKRMCVRLYRRTDGSVLLRDCPVGLDDRVAPPRDWIG